ncbi:MAG: autotransporter domain-containing protein [Gammaproteobacteria bacterium]|nr:autotransporter domain-containing protein [Gammaproteobacteria bacterium]MBU1491871.1 autotransporter domain-containing protein [Gammaproteobacteria bacterium]MBU2322911.1 autotransporter domain-containing protein [Gammaproteobacteria bacterium]
MPNARSIRPQWQTAALSSAIAALCANGLFVSQAHAVAGCGPTVSADQGQCTPYYSDTVVVQEGVTVSATDAPAVLYSTNLGEDTGGSGVLGSFTNNGSILSSGLGEDSFTFSGRSVAGVQINGNLLGNMTNNGLISATSTDDVYRVVAGVNMQSLSGTLNNHGTITADVAGSGGGQAVGVRISNMSGGELNNYGTIEGVISSSDVGQAYSIYALNAEGGGTINNRAGGVLRGHLYSGGSSVNVTNAGTIDLPMDSFAGYVSGDFTQTDSGVLRLMASGDGEDEYSQMFVGGTASIAGTAFVDVRSTDKLAVGQTLSRVLGASELTGNFAQVQDNSALFNFQSIATEGENGYIDFQLVKALSAVEAVDSNNNSNSRGAAGVLDTIIDQGTTNSNMQTLINELGKLGTSKEVSDAVAQTTPQLAANTALASRAALGGINRVIQSRVESNRGMSSGDAFYGDSKLWLKPFGSWADQDDRSGVSGFDASTAGLVVGADGTLSESTRVGVAFAYANSNIDGNSDIAPNSADVDMFQVLGYGSYSLDAQTELNFQAGVGQNNTDGQREILFLGETAKADYSSLVATAGIGLARTFELSEQTAFTPSVRTDYTWIKDEGYTEKGSSANLKVDSQSTDQMIVGLDGKLSHEFMPGTSIAANLGVGYDILNSQSSVTSAFAGEPGIGFKTNGLDSSPWSQRGGLGLIHATEQGAEVSLRYDVEHSDGFLNQTASVKLRWDI